jgi:hypothetical protein
MWRILFQLVSWWINKFEPLKKKPMVNVKWKCEYQTLKHQGEGILETRGQAKLIMKSGSTFWGNVVPDPWAHPTHHKARGIGYQAWGIGYREP